MVVGVDGYTAGTGEAFQNSVGGPVWRGLEGVNRGRVGAGCGGCGRSSCGSLTGSSRGGGSLPTLQQLCNLTLIILIPCLVHIHPPHSECCMDIKGCVGIGWIVDRCSGHGVRECCPASGCETVCAALHVLP